MSNEIRKEYILTKNELDNNVELCDLAHLEGIVEKLDTKLTRKESIEALNNIKKHIEEKRNYYNELETKVEELKRKLWKGKCQHEILYKNYDQYVCIICDRWFYRKDINFDYFYVELGNQSELSKFNKIIEKIILNDEKFFEVLENCVEEETIENIKIYKR